MPTGVLFKVLREHIVCKGLSVEQRSDEVMRRYAGECMGDVSEAELQLLRLLFEVAVSGREELRRRRGGLRRTDRGHEGQSSLCCECKAVPLVRLVNHWRGVWTDRKVRQTQGLGAEDWRSPCTELHLRRRGLRLTSVLHIFISNARARGTLIFSCLIAEPCGITAKPDMPA